MAISLPHFTAFSKERIKASKECPLAIHFLRSSSLKPHMSIHVGEPYACTQCGRRYSSRGNLGRHQALCNAASST
ncbi:unnamed protein product [Boreogadus saida]